MPTTWGEAEVEVYFNRLFLLATEACDSRCVLCDYWLIKRPRLIDPELVETRVVPFIKDNGLSVVCISGGEPTLHPELPRIVRAVRAAGATATLATSTTRLGDHFEELRDLVTHYMVSLDGPDRESYHRSRGIDRFDDVLAWVRRIRAETKAETAISFVLQSSNISLVRPMYELCLAIGVQRFFLRVPDLKPGAFGRTRSVRSRTLKQATVVPEQVEGLRRDLAWLVDEDVHHGLLGQTPETLRRKVRFFDCIASGVPYQEDDLLCDVPLTSLVLQADGRVRPCFYLPQVQDFDQDPANGNAFVEVYTKMLHDEDFRRSWCNACQQFDGHKHAIDLEAQ